MTKTVFPPSIFLSPALARWQKGGGVSLSPLFEEKRDEEDGWSVYSVLVLSVHVLEVAAPSQPCSLMSDLLDEEVLDEEEGVEKP